MSKKLDVEFSEEEMDLLIAILQVVSKDEDLLVKAIKAYVEKDTEKGYLETALFLDLPQYTVEELIKRIEGILIEKKNKEIKKTINWPIPREDVIARIVEEYRHDSENLFLQDVLSFGFEGFDSWDDEKLEREIQFLMNQKSTYDGFSIEGFLKSSY